MPDHHFPDVATVRAAVQEEAAAEVARYGLPADSPPADPAQIPTAVLIENAYSGKHGVACAFLKLPEDGRNYLWPAESEDGSRPRVWNGSYWEEDILGKVYSSIVKLADAYKAVLRLELRKEEPNKALVKRLSSIIDGLLNPNGQDQLLRAIRRVPGGHVVPMAQVDAKPWLIPVLNGVINLRTFALEKARREDYLSRGLLWAFDEQAQCPEWRNFIETTFEGNARLIRFVQRLFGYALLGRQREHIFAVLFGRGRNGKGVLMLTLQYVLGPYYRAVAPELLMEQRTPRSPAAPTPELVDLHGARLAVASESGKGDAFSTAKVKHFSGGDPITCRSPHDKANFTFLPDFVLFLQTNDRPKAPPTDYAFWQRLVLIPFNLSFVENPTKPHERKRDPDLVDKLKAEAPGILTWLVEGALRYQCDGLDIPEEVRAATDDYRTNEDLIGQFMADCCEVEEDREESAGTLYKAFCRWYADNINAARNPPSVRTFGEDMVQRFPREKRRDGKWYRGLRLVPGTPVV